MGLLDDAIREHLELKRRRGADPSEIERLEREALGPVRRAPQESRELLVDPEPGVAATYPPEEEVTGWSLTEDEPAPFDHSAEGDGERLPEWTARHEDLSEPAPSPEPPPEREYDLPKHHEIAEEWEAHQRQSASEREERDRSEQHENQDLLGAPTGGYEPDSPAPAPPATPAAATPPPAIEDEGETHLDPRPPEHMEQETAEYDVESEDHADGPAGRPDDGDDVLEETPDFLQDTPDHDRLWFEQRPPRDFEIDN